MLGGPRDTVLGDALELREAVVPTEARPFVALAAACLAGVMLGYLLPWGWWWLLASGGPVGGMAIMLARGRRQAAMRWGLIATVTLMAGWYVWQAEHVPADHIGRYVAETTQLAEITGVVANQPEVAERPGGAFARFDYRPPRTTALLAVDGIVLGPERTAHSASGKLLLHLSESDHTLQYGQRIRAAGWLSSFPPASNPGEMDFARFMRDRGVAGRLSLGTRHHWQLLAEPNPWHPPTALHALRQALSDELLHSLRLGMSEGDRSLALLETLLLGLWGRALGNTYEMFRRVGLAHLMTISGAHLAILLGLVWAMVRLVVPRPKWAGIAVLVVLGLYLLALPMHVPIVRAAIMAGIFAGGYASGRRVRGMAMLAIAVVAVLVWRPGDLFTPGFQLSFGIVAALMLFTRPVARWLWPTAGAAVGEPADASLSKPARLGTLVAWRVVDVGAANLVAFVVALPVVAWHFQLVSPLAMVVSLLALPPVAALLWLGYLKMVAGLALPSASIVLAGPLTWLSETLLGLVDHAQHWPGAAVELSRSPSLAWVIGALAVGVALLAGGYARRKAALAASVSVLLLWAVAMERHWPEAWAQRGQPQTLVTINMLAVGEGNAYLVRMPGYTLLFDCGSQSYLDVGLRTIVPALQSLGVRRLDAIFLSHADLDHYSGTLDVLDRLRVGQVAVPPQLLAEADANPHGATAHLIAGLHERRRTPQPVARGWRYTADEADLQFLWPPADHQFQRSNDHSLVLAIRAAGRTVILNGDIESEAVRGLLALEPNLHADVSELPHHGSFAPGSIDWLTAIRPSILLQSSSRRRLEHDRWPAQLEAMGLNDTLRLITAERGMIELRILSNGAIHWHSFRKPPQAHGFKPLK